MFGTKQPSNSIKHQQPADDRPRVYGPHREFASARDFADWIRETEVEHIIRTGLGW